MTIDQFRTEYKKLLLSLTECKTKAASLGLLVTDTMLLHKEVNRKENVIVKLQEQRNAWKSAYDTLQLVSVSKDETIKEQERTIKKIGKPKRWGLGPVVGYGLAGALPNVFVGVGVQYSFIRL
ncbi:DUF6808 domain-containing protein [Segetibacter aerophilus]|uniref:DUF6808 domain-containing protein n=1 Tax=Segetibacter aerophilus TaxID=670293 RepID=A0A512B9Z4_9BACT|nr:hypothetical protein [Segetibacter aerophilus]GEO08786.1 hypothetical protein SAE01_12820 [Segetibacter aerophilus]